MNNEEKVVREYFLDTARLMAITSTLSELIGRHGISDNQFQLLFQRKVNHYMMKCHQMNEDKDPNFAAAYKTLREDELLSDSELPLFFPS